MFRPFTAQIHDYDVGLLDQLEVETILDGLGWISRWGLLGWGDAEDGCLETSWIDEEGVEHGLFGVVIDTPDQTAPIQGA